MNIGIFYGQIREIYVTRARTLVISINFKNRISRAQSHLDYF